VSKARHRRAKLHRQADQHAGQRRYGARNTDPSSQGSVSYRPRDDRGPASMKDLFDRHISRATETDDLQQRYLQLLRFIRSTVFSIGLVLLAACVLFAGGITVAVAYAGVPLLEALGFGAGGSAVIILAVVSRIRRWFRGVDMLSRADQAEWAPDLEADEVADEIAAVEESVREPMELPPPSGAR
jgi:hypothetical protein